MPASRSVWVTRDEPADGPLCEAIRAVGLVPILQPVIARIICADVRPHIERLEPADWLVLTSAFAARNIAPDAVRSRVAVVGDATADAAREAGLRIDRVSPDGTGAGLWGSLRRDPEGARRICYPRSSLARIPEPMEGVELDAPVLYETVEHPYDETAVIRVACAAVASPSASRVLTALADPPRCASIGPTTSAALRASGVEPWLEAPEPAFPSLARAIAEAMTARGETG
jgi:uroporphyrinogen-III synthase